MLSNYFDSVVELVQMGATISVNMSDSGYHPWRLWLNSLNPNELPSTMVSLTFNPSLTLMCLPDVELTVCASRIHNALRFNSINGRTIFHHSKSYVCTVRDLIGWHRIFQVVSVNIFGSEEIHALYKPNEISVRQFYRLMHRRWLLNENCISRKNVIVIKCSEEF